MRHILYSGVIGAAVLLPSIFFCQQSFGDDRRNHGSVPGNHLGNHPVNHGPSANQRDHRPANGPHFPPQQQNGYRGYNDPRNHRDYRDPRDHRDYRDHRGVPSRGGFPHGGFGFAAPPIYPAPMYAGPTYAAPTYAAPTYAAPNYDAPSSSGNGSSFGLSFNTPNLNFGLGVQR